MYEQLGKVDSRPYSKRRVLAHMTLAQRRAIIGLLFVLPGILPLFIFVVYPMVSALYLSFTNWQLVGTPVLQGFGNYTDLLGDTQFHQSLIVTLEVAVGTALPSALLPFVVALLLDARVPLTGWYQPLFFLLTILPTVPTPIFYPIFSLRNDIITTSLVT